MAHLECLATADAGGCLYDDCTTTRPRDLKGFKGAEREQGGLIRVK